MSDVQAAVETIQKAQKWRLCGLKHTSHPQGWLRPGVEQCSLKGFRAYRCQPLPDPLADTPEGDHEFMEIMRWAEAWFIAKELEPWFLFRDGFWQYAVGDHKSRHASFKAAFLLALADALRKEGE